MAETITADMIIHDIVSRHPATVKVFHGHGLPCTACAVGSRESVAGGARTHRFNPEKLELLLQDLNAAANGRPTSVAPKKAPVGRGIPLQMAGPDRPIKQVIAVMSGKGGVGKSLVTGLLAVSLRRQGLRVGVLDGDITGPSIARMFGTRGQPAKSASGGIEPLTSRGGIKVMSMNMFLENESDPVVWRGPMVSSAIKQFYSDVDWEELDYLLVDLPPGTSDAPMTVLQSLPVDGVVIVSSPQMRSEERRVGKECRYWRDWSSDVCSSDLICSLRTKVTLWCGAGQWSPAPLSNSIAMWIGKSLTICWWTCHLELRMPL